MFHDRSYEVVPDQGLLERVRAKARDTGWWDLVLLAIAILLLLAFFGALRPFV